MKFTVFMLISLFSCAGSSHFRGGSISWKPTAMPQQIRISYQMAWRRSYSGGYCDDNKISSRGVLSISANLYCRVGCDEKVNDMRGACIAYSASENWSLGEGSFIYTLPTPGIEYKFRLENCCWMSLRNGNGGGNMRMTLTVNTTTRADTGAINSSPVVTMAPMVRLLAGCPNTFKIPVIDADGDTVRCRFPGSDSNECGYLCDGLPGSAIDTDTCIFSYNTTSGTGTYGVHIQVEDFANTASRIVLSSVPLQFLILVFDDPLNCDDAPSFVNPTPPEGSCHVVKNTFSQTLVARSKKASHTVTHLSLMGPIGMTKTSLSPYGSSGREWSITVTWSPASNQGGLHLMCFSAEIENKLTSTLTCIDLLKGTPSSIELAQGCLEPLGVIESHLIKTIKMCFNRKFVRPTTDKFLTIHHANGTEAHTFNMTDPAVASFPVSGGREVTVTLGSDLLPLGEYYILVSSGSVAADPLECVSDWEGITQPFFWNFTVVDLSPPVLTFTSSPIQRNDNETFTLTWDVNEALSIESCNLTTPTSTSIITCNRSFSRTNLVAGNYSISIEIEDLSGNKAQPSVHQWIIVDVTPPSLIFTSNPSLTKSNATIAWTVSEPLISSACVITYPNATQINESCDDQWDAVDLPRGSYQIGITLVDLSSMTGGPFVHTWINIDVTPPVLWFILKPNQSLSNVNITWVTSEVVTAVCEIEGPSFHRSVVCDAMWSEDYLPEGNFTISVTVYDESLNMAGPFQHRWLNRDVKPPELTLTSTPSCNKSSDNATVTWTYNEDATSACVVKTSVKVQVFPVCDESWSGTFLPEGNIILEILGTDKSQNFAQATYVWYNDDVTPPVLTFTRSDAVTVNAATIMWSMNEPALASCTLITPYNTTVFSCDSNTWSETNLQGGDYSLNIRLIDHGNNTADFGHNWHNVDTIKPRLTFSESPSRTYSNATITWTVTEPVNASCTIHDPTNFTRSVSCDVSWVGVTIPPGSFTLTISLTDSSGNFGGPYVHSWINEDVTPPSLQWNGIPPSQTTGSIVLSWTTSEAVTSVCIVQSPVQMITVFCNNSWVGAELRNGNYSLTVKMVDGSGNTAESVHQWNNNVKELVYEVILTLSNVDVTDITNKTSTEYSKLVAESQTALESFYKSSVDSFKAIHIRDITLVSKRSRRRRSIQTNSDVSVDHDVVIAGSNMSASTAALSKTLSTLSTGASSIQLRGSNSTFYQVTLLVNGRTENVTFTRRTRTCEIAELYVTCSLREHCDEESGLCKSNSRPDNNGMILSIGLGVSSAVILVLVTVIISIFYLRKKQEREKKRKEIENEKKLRFGQTKEGIAWIPRIMYRPFKYWQ